MKKIISIMLSFLLLAVSGCSKQAEAITRKADLSKLSQGVQLVTEEKPAEWGIHKPETIKEMKKQFSDTMGLDVRSTDLSALNLKDTDLSLASFDSKTVWPASMPDTFDAAKVLELGKNPGLGIRELHKKGITGKGVNVAIIDQALLLNHREYKGKVMLYEQLHTYDEYASMHGPAVTSILAGDTIGVAPDVKIYYINTFFGDVDKKTGELTLNLSYMAQAIERVLEINEALPEHQKIKVLSISRGFAKEENPDVYHAIEKAKKAGIFVVTTSTAENYDYEVFGAGRSSLADPEKSTSYGLPEFLIKEGNKALFQTQKIIFTPMDNRTTAGPLSTQDYAHFARGGFSWSTPWMAGMYALCLQIDPKLTAEQFLETAYASGDNMKLVQLGIETDSSCVLINPKRLIKEIEKAAKH